MHGNAGNGVDIMVVILAALGFQQTGAEVVGGALLALAGALSASRILARGMVRGAVPLGFWGTIVTGLFVAVVVALLSTLFLPTWPIQLPMAAGGFFSSFAAPFCLKVAAGISKRGDLVSARLVDRVLPEDKGD